MKKTNVPSNYNTGENLAITPLDIGHKDYAALLSPDIAFWSLVKKDRLSKALLGGKFHKALKARADEFQKEMDTLRHGLRPSAVYFNPTERCNLDCSYCYIPRPMRKNGVHMDKKSLFRALAILKDYFAKVTPGEDRKPSVIFHGSEPMLNRDAVFPAIEKHRDDFDFGIQSNATLIDDSAADFILANNVGLGVSLDGASENDADGARRDWEGKGRSEHVKKVVKKFSGHPRFNVICTITKDNMAGLSKTIGLFHKLGVRICMLNILRCTQPGSRHLKPDEKTAAGHFIRALDKSRELHKKTGRKIVVANFANILLAILAPTARRLMCDISPCGGGRCFFAVSAKGDLFPCSEFIGLPEFNGGNIFKDDIQEVLDSDVFARVSKRRIEEVEFCSSCAIRHFCGSPCPAEAAAMNGSMKKRGAFCEFYEEQARHAFRIIADGTEDDFLYDNWDKGARQTLESSDLPL